MIPVAHALELTYPSFLPLKNSMGLGEFATVLFGAAIGVGSLVAVGVIIWAGWQFSTSGASPGKRVEARRRIVETFFGLAMLLLVAVVLRTINPELLRLPNTKLEIAPVSPVDISPTPQYTSTPGSAFQTFPLGKELDKHRDFLTRTNFVLDDLITALKNELDLCTKEACEARTPASYINNICSVRSCSFEAGATSGPAQCRQGRCDRSATCCVAPECPSETCLPDPDKNFCELKGGISDICPGRQDAKQDLPQLYDIFVQLKTFFDTDLAAVRTQIQTCRSTRSWFLYNYSYARQLLYPGAKTCSDCKDGVDYFCATDEKTATRIHLPLDRLIALEGQFIQLEQKIYDEINLCSCSNSEFTCPSNFASCLAETCGTRVAVKAGGGNGFCEGPGCRLQYCWSFPGDNGCADVFRTFACYASQGVGSCGDRVTNPNPRPGGVGTDPVTGGKKNIHPATGELVDYSAYKKSCPPELWTDLEKLHAIRQELEALKGTLGGFASTIDSEGVALVSSPTTPFFFGACPVTQNRINQDPWTQCPDKGVGCCPSDAMRQDINACRNEDFYECGK